MRLKRTYFSAVSLLTSICVVLFLAIHSAVPAEANDSGFLSVQLAVIEDADGFVNVRSRPDAKSDVVQKIQKDEFFTCEPSESDWWRVKDFFNNEGYMHRSRIRLVKDLPKKDIERLFVNPPVAPKDELVDIHEASEKFRDTHRIALGSDITLSGSLFSNDELRQCIYLEHYTDGMLPKMVLFSSKEAPDEVFEELAIHKGGEFASLDDKKAYWPRIFAASTEVPAQHFQTVQGVRLGDDVSKAAKIFGKPHNQRQGSGMSIYEWGFPGGLYYGSEYSESSLGFFDIDRVTDKGELIKEPALNESQYNKIQRHLQSPRGDEFIKGLFDWVLLRTRVARLDTGLGFYVQV